MKPLHILWQRVVDAHGATCDRCQSTQHAVEHALPKLKEALALLGLEPVFESRTIDLESFKGKPSESNRLWIEGKSIEEWLDASVGQSKCCSVCGGSECRTLELGGASFEAIPEDLILRAVLVAAARSSMLPDTDRPGDKACCSRDSCAPQQSPRAPVHDEQ